MVDLTEIYIHRSYTSACLHVLATRDQGSLGEDRAVYMRVSIGIGMVPCYYLVETNQPPPHSPQVYVCIVHVRQMLVIIRTR